MTFSGMNYIAVIIATLAGFGLGAVWYMVLGGAWMRAMKNGDLAFFYHSVGEKACVGIVKVVAEAHPDSTDGTGQWECVDVAAVTDLPKPVTLAEIRTTPQLKDMVLVNNSRLSVQPVTAGEWRKVCALGDLKDPPTA